MNIGLFFSGVCRMSYATVTNPGLDRKQNKVLVWYYPYILPDNPFCFSAFTNINIIANDIVVFERNFISRNFISKKVDVPSGKPCLIIRSTSSKSTNQQIDKSAIQQPFHKDFSLHSLGQSLYDGCKMI